MFYKYLKLILLSTVFLQASPKAFSSLGNEIEAFQEDCKAYQELSYLHTKIRESCTSFNLKAIKAFKFGYKVDNSNNTNEVKLNKYLSFLRELDENKELILRLVYSEAKKARKQNNFKLYSQLISNDKVKLYPSDYEFMEKNKEIFSQNKRYISHVNYLKSLEDSRKPILVTTEQVTNDKVSTTNQQRIQPQTYKKVRKPTKNISSVIMYECKKKWGTDYRMVKYCVEKQSKAKSITSSMPNNTIKANCKKKWGTDYRMVKYCVEKQSEAKSIVTLDNCQNLWGSEQRQCLDNQRKTKRALSDIKSNELSAMAKCRKKWGNNYRMVQYCAEKHGRLDNVTSSMSTDTSIMVRCKKKWGTDYRMVKYCVEKQSEAYQEISSITDSNTVQDKCKNKWGTDYSTCISKQMKRQRKLSPIIDKCKKKWGTDHGMVKYCIEKG